MSKIRQRVPDAHANISIDNYVHFDQLEARKVMRVDQLNAGENMWVNNI